MQYPAGWENAREIKFAQGFTSPAPRDFVGPSPLSAPESIAVYNFTVTHNFRLILAYHSQGEVIYWRFLDYNPPDSRYIGEEFARVSGYTLEDTPYSSSFAGYKDWFIQTYNRPGYTIEVGRGENPLPISQFNQIYRDNIDILGLGMVL
ncbi:MAG: M14 family zinc carboxypeptidase [Clostridia bacterium]